jgi:hypothetical protein
MLGPLFMDTSMITYLDGPTGTLCETDALARMTGSKAPLVMIGTSEGAGPDMNDLTIRGTAGSLRIWDWYRLQHATKGEWNDVLGTDRAQLAAAAYAAQLDELSKLLDGTPSSIATFAESLAVQVLVEGMLGGAS